jgi:hypothetical protein
MPAHDPNKAIDLINNSKADYVVGLTEPVFEANSFDTDYFEYVNAFRRHLNTDLSAAQKAEMISGHIARSSNPFGDIGALMFHRKCLATLNRGVKAGLPAFTTFPDLDIYLTLFANHSGACLDEIVSSFVFNDVSPAVRRNSESDSKLHGLYAEYEATMPLHFITAFKLKPLTEHLSQEQKRFFFHHIQYHTAGILGCYDQLKPHSGQKSVPRHHMAAPWRPITFVKRFAKFISRLIQRVMVMI